jgi:hypothetical protein
MSATAGITRSDISSSVPGLLDVGEGPIGHLGTQKAVVFGSRWRRRGQGPVPAVAVVVGQERAEQFVHRDESDLAAWTTPTRRGQGPWADAETAATASHPDLEEMAVYPPNFVLLPRALVPGTARAPARAAPTDLDTRTLAAPVVLGCRQSADRRTFAVTRAMRCGRSGEFVRW